MSAKTVWRLLDFARTILGGLLILLVTFLDSLAKQLNLKEGP